MSSPTRRRSCSRNWARVIPTALHPKAKHELFECTVEIITGVCTTVAEARADLEATLAEVRGVAQPRGLALISAATHPFSHWSSLRISPHPRYTELVERIQWPARRLAIHGIHFHVGVRSGEKAVAIANSLAFHLPVFLASVGVEPVLARPRHGHGVVAYRRSSKGCRPPGCRRSSTATTTSRRSWRR